MTCPRCKAESRPGRRFCARCGSPLPRVCDACSFENDAGDRFCGGCGRSLGEATRAARSGKVSEPDRRQLTVLFCDLVGSTDLSTSRDPEELRKLVRLYQAKSVPEIQHFGGYVSRFMGDGIMALFGYPQALEDAAERATRAALAIIDAIEALDGQLDVPLKVRIGIATGVVVAGDLIGEGSAEEQAIIGETPNLAARIQSLAAHNEIYIADRTHQLLHGRIECEDMGARQLKGFPDPERVWRVRAAAELSELEEAYRLPIVGRAAELDLLGTLWEKARDSRGQVVLLSGEGGIGKTRLIEELRRRVEPDHPRTFLIRCSPFHQNTALYPMIEFLRRWIDGSGHSSEAERLDMLETLLLELDVSLQEAVPILASLLGMNVPAARYALVEGSPQQIRRRTYDVLCEIMLAESRSSPLLSVWEDLHWADPSTVELLGMLVEQAEKCRQLAVLSFRPDFASPWEARGHVNAMPLAPLDAREAADLVQRLAPDLVLGSTLAQLVDGADGIPLFVEELTREFVELASRSGSVGHTTGRIPIPATLQDLLMARLDRLGAAREVAQVASALGRRFSKRMLEQLIPLGREELEAALERAVDSGILNRKGEGDDERYRFRHALIQDAAYHSMLHETRRKVHQRIVRALDLSSEQIVPELRAHHCAEAGMIDAAITWWRRAGEEARERFANVEAVSHLQRALALLETQPAGPARDMLELSLLLSSGLSLTAIKGYGSAEVGEAYRRSYELCLQFADQERSFPVLHGLYRFYFVRCELETALEVSQKMLSLAESLGKTELLFESHRMVGWALSMQGRPEQAKQHLERVAQLAAVSAVESSVETPSKGSRSAERTGLAALPATAQSKTAHEAATLYWIQGEPDRARRTMEQVLTVARQSGEPFNLAWNLNYAMVVYQHCGYTEQVREAAEECIRIASLHGMPFWLAGGCIMRGWSTWSQGNVAQGIQEMRDGLEAWQSTGARVFLSYYLGLLAGALIEDGAVEEGRSIIDAAFEHVRVTSERWWLPELHRLRAELLWRNGSESTLEVGDALRESIACALAHDAVALELRAHMSRCRMVRSDQALAELRRCVARFREGHSTADLRRAAEILQHRA